MNVADAAKAWSGCLGSPLTRVTVRYFWNLVEQRREPYAIADVMLAFGSAENTRFIAWEQGNADFALGIGTASAYKVQDFVEVDGRQDDVVSPAIGKAHTAIDFFGSAEDGEVLAARMRFDSHAFVVACGDSAFDADAEKAKFRHFGLDETFLWSEDQFAAVLAEHLLERLKTISV